MEQVTQNIGLVRRIALHSVERIGLLACVCRLWRAALVGQFPLHTQSSVMLESETLWDCPQLFNNSSAFRDTLTKSPSSLLTTLDLHADLPTSWPLETRLLGQVFNQKTHFEELLNYLFCGGQNRSPERLSSLLATVDSHPSFRFDAVAIHVHSWFISDAEDWCFSGFSVSTRDWDIHHPNPRTPALSRDINPTLVRWFWSHGALPLIPSCAHMIALGLDGCSVESAMTKLSPLFRANPTHQTYWSGLKVFLHLYSLDGLRRWQSTFMPSDTLPCTVSLDGDFWVPGEVYFLVCGILKLPTAARGIELLQWVQANIALLDTRIASPLETHAANRHLPVSPISLYPHVPPFYPSHPHSISNGVGIRRLIHAMVDDGAANHRRVWLEHFNEQDYPYVFDDLELFIELGAWDSVDSAEASLNHRHPLEVLFRQTNPSLKYAQRCLAAKRLPQGFAPWITQSDVDNPTVHPFNVNPLVGLRGTVEFLSFVLDSLLPSSLDLLLFAPDHRRKMTTIHSNALVSTGLRSAVETLEMLHRRNLWRPQEFLTRQHIINLCDMEVLLWLMDHSVPMSWLPAKEFFSCVLPSPIKRYHARCLASDHPFEHTLGLSFASGYIDWLSPLHSPEVISRLEWLASVDPNHPTFGDYLMFQTDTARFRLPQVLHYQHNFAVLHWLRAHGCHFTSKLLDQLIREGFVDPYPQYRVQHLLSLAQQPTEKKPNPKKRPRHPDD